MTGGASPSRAATSGHDSRPGTSCNGSVEEVAPVASAAAVGLSSPTPTSSAADSDAHAPAPQPPNAMNALHQPRSTSPAMSVSVSTSTGDSRAARAGPSAGTNSPKKRRKVNHGEPPFSLCAQPASHRSLGPLVSARSPYSHPEFTFMLYGLVINCAASCCTACVYCRRSVSFFSL